MSDHKILLETAARLDDYADRSRIAWEREGREAGEALHLEGTEVYQAVVPVAHRIYAAWARPKQVRGSRQLRVAVGSHSTTGAFWTVGQIETGEYHTLSNLPKHSDDMRRFASALRELVREDQNPDQTDPYWDRIRGATIVTPRPGYCVPVLFSRENGRGLFDGHGKADSGYSLEDPGEIAGVIDDLVGGKVIFFPIATREQSVAYGVAQGRQPEMQFEVDMIPYRWDWDREDLVVAGRSQGVLKAQELEPFTEGNARRVLAFLRDHTTFSDE